MPEGCENNGVIAVRCSDTLERQWCIAECGVTALRAANAVKVFRVEEGRDKELKTGHSLKASVFRSGKKQPQLSLLTHGFSFSVNGYHQTHVLSLLLNMTSVNS